MWEQRKQRRKRYNGKMFPGDEQVAQAAGLLFSISAIKGVELT